MNPIAQRIEFWISNIWNQLPAKNLGDSREIFVVTIPQASFLCRDKGGLKQGLEKKTYEIGSEYDILEDLKKEFYYPVKPFQHEGLGKGFYACTEPSQKVPIYLKAFYRFSLFDVCPSIYRTSILCLMAHIPLFDGVTDNLLGCLRDSE